MTRDPYTVLGIAKTATQDEIRKAYRNLAKKLHPDLHPGDAGKQAEFQEVAAANDILGDPEKRRRFDAGEIDASGQERPERQYYHQYADTGAGRRYDQTGPGGFEDLSDVFADLFRNRSQGGFEGFDARGNDMRYQLEVDFLDAARGARRAITLPDGKAIDLAIPAGLKDGQTLRLRGKGGAGYGQGPDGDALVTISVRPHPLFTRNENDIEVELPITFDEAVLGGKVEVPTIGDAVSMTVPAGASSGHRLRLKGKGIRPAKGPAGDQLVRLKIVLPDRMDAGMTDLARKWRETVRHDPRRGMGRTS
ncbi:MAG: J domain-containing protein [Pseudooceanicola sp.]|nr:J domain-containing protein [Pseudooceanicola sp.]